MLSADTSADNSVSGYIVGEQVTLTASPAGSSYAWALSKPSGATARSDLSATGSSSVTFTPDVGGYYVASVDVSGTTYVLRLAAVAIGTVSSVSALRLMPLADSQVPTPASGAALYFSSTQGAPAVKLPNGSVSTIDLTAVS